MGGEKQKRNVIVAPFECAWREELRFKEAGRGCVAFEASALNDVTLVFREQVGSQHYHYKMDNLPNYTVVLGSHRNRRLKIEVDGKTVADVAGSGLCCSSTFQSYWIAIYDGLISVGKGKYPFQDIFFQWLDTNPNCNVQYVGLSSWDKHVGYRNVNVLPLIQYRNSLRSHISYEEYECEVDQDLHPTDGAHGVNEWGGLSNFLESWDLADVLFHVGRDAEVVPAHKVILDAVGVFDFHHPDGNVISLPSVAYPVLCAFLQYIYTGTTQVNESQLGPLGDLSSQFQVSPLSKQCAEIIDRFKTNKKLYDGGKNVEICFNGNHNSHNGFFLLDLPINSQKLWNMLQSGQNCDVNIYCDEQRLVSRGHKAVLGLWSAPFAKMFTNGMHESNSPEIYVKDVSVKALKIMLQFMYTCELDVGVTVSMPDLVSVLLLADQFCIAALNQECCKRILENLSEDSVCSILHAVSSVITCKQLEEACKKHFAMHFDYCTTSSVEFILLEEAIFTDILKHSDLAVISEERVLDAILMWCTEANDVCGWEAMDELLEYFTLENLFKDRLPVIEDLLACTRFPLMPPALLKKLERSRFSQKIPIFKELVIEAIQHSEFGLVQPEIEQNERFQHRKSSFKEFQYLCDGDNNGVIYYAGTSYGEHQWVNPFIAKKVNVTASSPTSRYTDPKALVSRTYQGTSYAGPLLEDGQNCSWWMIDMGKNHQLMCSYYTFRQDGSRTYIRSWALQGSLDGVSWTNLRNHENDQTISRPAQFASWPIHGTVALLPFRFFRVYMTGPTSDVLNPWNLCICFLELYGYFR